MSPETWSNLLYVYGPSAVLVFLVAIALGKVRSHWQQSDQINRLVQTFFLMLYGLTWVAIFVVTFFVVFAWWKINITRRPQITGTVDRLLNTEVLGTTFAELYLHKKVKSSSYSDYDFLLINNDNKQWPDGTKVKFTIQTPRENSKEENVYEYELSILSDFYKNGVVLKRRHDKLFLAHNGQETELAGELLPSDALPSFAMAEPAIKPTWSLFPTVHAQSKAQAMQPGFSAYEISVGLESPDAIVRRRTRYQLSLQDQTEVLPWINSVLSDKTSSYRLRLGVLVALNNMPNLPVQSLFPETITAIQNTLNDPDDALRNEALELANKYQLTPVTVYEHDNFEGRSQVFGPGIYRYDQGRLGSLPNDSASSIRVAKGFAVRLCDNEGEGKGGGMCETFRAGNHSLVWGPKGMADKVSFIQVYPD